MELRLLRYFLTVAKEQSFTKAAEQLHITQPTLSRQMAAFEEDLGITLFIRNGKKISLTDEGILLKRRALEILNFEERTLEELKGKEEVVESTITIGCGEFAAVETLAKICKTYKEKYPLVQIVLHTATADVVYEMMNKGIVDIALFMEPVDTEGLDYIRITDCDHWCVGMRPDDPLAEKEFIKKEDLIGKPLILPERMNVQSELANWFGKDFSKLQIAFTLSGRGSVRLLRHARHAQRRGRAGEVPELPEVPRRCASGAAVRRAGAARPRGELGAEPPDRAGALRQGRKDLRRGRAPARRAGRDEGAARCDGGRTLP